MDYKKFIDVKCFIVYADIPIDSEITDQKTKEYNVFKVYGRVVNAKTDAVVIKEENGRIHRISDKMILVFRTNN